MIEAYEIGIKLALQDGVSDGITVIRRELDALDHAIASTTSAIAQLQRVGVAALKSSDAGFQQVAGSVRPAGLAANPGPISRPEADGDAGAAARPVVGLVSERDRPVQADTRVAPVSAATEPTGTRPAEPAQPVMPAVRIGAAVGAPASPAARAAPVEAGPAAAEGERMPAAPAAAAASVVVSTPVQVHNSYPVSSLSLRPAAQPAAKAGEPVRAPDVSLIAPSVSARSDALAQRPVVAQVARPRPQAPVPSSATPRETQFAQAATQGRPALPTSLRGSGHGTGAAAPVSDMPPAAASSYAPPGAGSRSQDGAMRGDVFLDGAKVGRWMSERMARDAGRPNAGPTGFDPKRSVAWPGAAVS